MVYGFGEAVSRSECERMCEAVRPSEQEVMASLGLMRPELRLHTGKNSVEECHFSLSVGAANEILNEEGINIIIDDAGCRLSSQVNHVLQLVLVRVEYWSRCRLSQVNRITT